MTAQIVHESWTTIKERLCKRFLEHLRDRIAQEAKVKLSKFSHDMRFGCKYVGEKTYANCLWLYRSSWTQYVEADKRYPYRRTSIRLDAEEHGPNGWFYSVSSPLTVKDMSDPDRDRRSRIETALKEEFEEFMDSDRSGSGDQYAGWYYADEHKWRWNALLPDLHRELEVNGGEITDYFVGEFLDLAVKAMPVIDRVEGSEA